MVKRILLLAIKIILLHLCICAEKEKVKGSINDVEHVIIFMQENRAFDHYYGSLKGVRGFNDRAHAGIQATKRGIFYQPTDKKDLTKYKLPWHVVSQRTSATCMDAPEMGFEADIKMWNGGKMDSWNTAREQGMGMAYFNRDDLPYYYQLADEFTIGDQYYQSTFTATNPNRLFLFSGSNGRSANQTTNATIPLDDDVPQEGFNWETLGEILERKGVSWKVYQELDNFNDNAFEWFKNYREADKDSPLRIKGTSHVHDLASAFAKDMDENKLPQVSIFVAQTVLSEHSNNHPAAGEDLTARLLVELKKRPEYFKKSAFILNYDEGGQYFDHHWTPNPPRSQEEGLSTVYVEDEIVTDRDNVKGRAPIGTGFRVPLIIVSPWTRGGHVVSEVFDHTSVLQFLEIRFDIKVKVISDWRRAIAGNLLSAFDFDNPDYTFPDLPDTNSYVDDSIYQCDRLPKPQIPIEQTVPTQENGVKPSRVLPYEFIVEDKVNENVLNLRIFAKGQSGGAFQLYDWKADNSIVKKYTIHSGAEINNEIVLNGEYDLSLHGPNGFVRHFKGNSAALSGSECYVETKYDSTLGKVLVDTFDKTEAGSCNFSVKDYVYHSFEDQKTLKSGSHIEIDVNDSGNWYDFTVFNTDKDNVTYSRRFMGRIERKGNTSDPAVGNEFFEFEKPKQLMDSPYSLPSKYPKKDKRNKDSSICQRKKNNHLCRNEDHLGYFLK